MSRLSLLLLAALIGCALSLVTAQHRARTQFIALQSEQEIARRLDHEWRELQLEAQTLTSGKRIEQKAARERGMLLPDAKRTLIVVVDQAPAEVAK
jgi:cell division protein FtsL